MNQDLSNIAELVAVENGQAVTTSHQVAKYFGKQHKHVLRAIRSLECSSEFLSAHFWANVENQIVGNARRNLLHYTMDKDGFMFLVMGFTGKKAAHLKEAYINAFNWMFAQIQKGRDDLFRQWRETVASEQASFQIASAAGRSLSKRREEKAFYQSRIQQLEHELIQPDLFLAA